MCAMPRDKNSVPNRVAAKRRALYRTIMRRYPRSIMMKATSKDLYDLADIRKEILESDFDGELRRDEIWIECPACEYSMIGSTTKVSELFRCPMCREEFEVTYNA